MKIIYRISDAGYNKVKPDYIDNEKSMHVNQYFAVPLIDWQKFNNSIEI